MQNLFIIATVIWVLTGIYWVVAAQNIKQAIKKEEIGFRIFYMIFWVVPFALTFFRILSIDWLNARVLPGKLLIEIIAFIGVLVSLAFMIWSRVVLGKNWSGRIAVKNDHQLITSGPYTMVRHPMYTGFIFAFLFSAILLGEVRGVISFVILLIGILMKLQKEERVIRNVFGIKYDEYAKRVKKLIPFIY
jgi:protein-S-isoprenylcysteine O-methyltransferase Ste14